MSSVTKQFTALAILELQEAGKLSVHHGKLSVHTHRSTGHDTAGQARCVPLSFRVDQEYGGSSLPYEQ
jgi:hypothetical protein